MQTILLDQTAVDAHKASREGNPIVNPEKFGRNCPNIQVMQADGSFVPMTCDGKDCLAAQIALKAVETALATA